MNGFKKCVKGHFYKEDLSSCPYCPEVTREYLEGEEDLLKKAAIEKENERIKNRRVIKTARDIDSINEAAKKGFTPLIKTVTKDINLSTKYAVWQNKNTKEIYIAGDYREELNEDYWEEVIGWTYYYPYHFESPYAAYLIPPDIVVGERVFIEDLIEDYIGIEWNQGDRYRLAGCEAIWNGSDLEILYSGPSHIIG